MSLRKRFFATKPAAPPEYPLPAPIRPVQPVYVIGDIHGCPDLVTRLLVEINRDVETTNQNNPHLIFVGDYIDRGEDSAGALALLMALQTSYPDKVTCLMGNHEKMLLDFLDRPEDRGGRWLRNGGLQTLASFRVGGLSETASATQLLKARDELLGALPNGTEDWLRGLPLTWVSGNVCVTHAGVNPALPICQQDDKTLLWGHRDFLAAPRRDVFWVVHGHTVVGRAEAKDGRISVDTGACFTGRLTVAVITYESVRFLETK